MPDPSYIEPPRLEDTEANTPEAAKLPFNNEAINKLVSLCIPGAESPLIAHAFERLHVELGTYLKFVKEGLVQSLWMSEGAKMNISGQQHIAPIKVANEIEKINYEVIATTTNAVTAYKKRMSKLRAEVNPDAGTVTPEEITSLDAEGRAHVWKELKSALDKLDKDIVTMTKLARKTQSQTSKETDRKRDYAFRWATRVVELGGGIYAAVLYLKSHYSVSGASIAEL
ncbi:hypothetical protein AB5N19_09900 [Seiridium cardinale]